MKDEKLAKTSQAGIYAKDYNGTQKPDTNLKNFFLLI